VEEQYEGQYKAYQDRLQQEPTQLQKQQQRQQRKNEATTLHPHHQATALDPPQAE
jgi:hypothetical protein